MLAAHYLALRDWHIACVILSGGLFTLRGLLRIADHPIVNRRSLRVLSWSIDTLLLTAGALLMIALHQYPPAQAWLTVKLLLLVLYIALGFVALKRARTRRGRMLSFLAALATFALMIGVAVRHHPAGWLALQPGRPSARGSQSIGPYSSTNSAKAALQNAALSTMTAR
jgi:uncharacterized membrane protein SirB2